MKINLTNLGFSLNLPLPAPASHIKGTSNIKAHEILRLLYISRLPHKRRPPQILRMLHILRLPHISRPPYIGDEGPHLVGGQGNFNSWFFEKNFQALYLKGAKHVNTTEHLHLFGGPEKFWNFSTLLRFEVQLTSLIILAFVRFEPKYSYKKKNV